VLERFEGSGVELELAVAGDGFVRLDPDLIIPAHEVELLLKSPELLVFLATHINWTPLVGYLGFQRQGRRRLIQLGNFIWSQRVGASIPLCGPKILVKAPVLPLADRGFTMVGEPLRVAFYEEGDLPQETPSLPSLIIQVPVLQLLAHVILNQIFTAISGLKVLGEIDAWALVFYIAVYGRSRHPGAFFQFLYQG